MVFALKAESLKTQIGKGTKLWVPTWHSGMCKAFLIHVGSALDAIEKEDTSRPTTKPVKPMWSNTNWWIRQRLLWGSLMEPLVGCRNFQEAFQGALENLSHGWHTRTQPASYVPIRPCKGQWSCRESQGQSRTSCHGHVAVYANLLSVDAKCAWNKIVQEQTQSDPYMDLQGISRKRPRRLLLVITVTN